MTSSLPADQLPERPSILRLAIARVIQTVLLYVVIGAALFLGAGRLDWVDAWAFLIAYFILALAGQAWLLLRDPALAIERSRWGPNTKAWDRILVSLNLLLTLALLVVIGVDAGRFGWSRVPALLRVAALVGFIPAFGLPLWASAANTYLAATVRIQAERGHEAVTEGPYAYLRHPMYLGMILYDVCLPLLLGSWFGLIVSALMILLVILRTALEDRALRAELPGYAEYADRVRYRLVPGVW